MNSLSGFNSQEIRRLHPYLSALRRRLKDIETGKIEIRIDGGGGGGGANIIWGTDDDILPTGDRNSGGSVNRVARADHQHLFKFPTTVPASTPDGSAYFDLSASAIRVYVGDTPTTRVVAGATTADVQPTGVRNTGTAPRYSFADHSHPTALLPQSDPQTPVANEIRFNTDNKVVRWNGSAWVPLSVETLEVEWGTNSDVQPTRLRSAGTATRFARADHSHPTAILPQDDPQTPETDEIRYNADNKIVRWDGSDWVEMSVESTPAGRPSDVQPTRLLEAGSSARFARADHSHPTAILPQTYAQSPVVDEIRYTDTNRLVRWSGSTWTNLTSALPVPADPLVLPYDNQVSSPQNRQLVNHSSWDNIGNATIFYRDTNNSQYRLVFARPLVVATASTPSGKDVWTNTLNELVLKEGTGSTKGSVLWNRRKGSTEWSPVAPQLSGDSEISFPTDVGVLTRSPLTGTSGSRRWFLRGVQEDGSFRAPFVGFATFNNDNATPAPAHLATNLNDAYAYFIRDLDRVDIVKPITDGNKYCTMLTHHIIAPPFRSYLSGSGAGHYVADEFWQGTWVVSYNTIASETSDLYFALPTFHLPLGIIGGRVLLYLHNPQSYAITTYWLVVVRTPTSTGMDVYATSAFPFTISANTTIVADLGFLSFPPSSTLSHHRSYPVSIIVARRKALETTNSNKVMCLGMAIVPQRLA